MRAKSILLAVSALLLAAAPALAQPEEPPPQLPPLALSRTSSDAEIAERLDAWLAALNQEGRFNGAVLVARDLDFRSVYELDVVDLAR